MSPYPCYGPMAGNWTAQGQLGSEERTRRLGTSKRIRVVTILAVSLGVLMVLGSLAVAQIVRASCSTGWQVVSSVDNSFAWTEPLPGLRAASWTGSVHPAPRPPRAALLRSDACRDELVHPGQLVLPAGLRTSAAPSSTSTPSAAERTALRGL